MHPLTLSPLRSSESKLESIRKDILAQVQSECWSRSQQLMKELTDFIEVFQTINSDIHAIARCSQKVGSPTPSFQPPQGPSCSNAYHILCKSQLSSQWGLMLLDCAHMRDLLLLILALFTWLSFLRAVGGPGVMRETQSCFQRQSSALCDSQIGIWWGRNWLSSERPGSDGGVISDGPCGQWVKRPLLESGASRR